ncbi:hypothetical protein LCGC14_2916590, partial [marine sediment metagenome]
MPDFTDIVGQDSALGQLQQIAAGERRPHAYIFAGPTGVGRRTTALALGRLLLCEEPAGRANQAGLWGLAKSFRIRQGCSACQSCRMLRADTHPDLHIVHRQLARYHEDQGVRSRVMQELGIDVIRQFLIAPAYR